MRYWQRFKMNPLICMEGDGGGDGGGGGGSENWQETLPEGVRDWDEAKGAESSDAFWNQMTDMRSHLGQSIRIPSKEAGTEDWDKFNSRLQEKVPTLINRPDLTDKEAAAQFYGSLGRPEKADDYTMPEFDTKEKLDMKQAEAFREVAHDIGLNQRQFEDVVKKFTTDNLELHAVRQDKLKTELEGLQKDWGFAYDKNNNIVKNFLAQSGAPDGVKGIFESGAMDAVSRKWFLDLASKFGGEETNFSNDNNSFHGKITPDEAVKRISEIMNNKEHAYWKPRDIAHDAALREMRELYELKLGEKATNLAPGAPGAS